MSVELNDIRFRAGDSVEVSLDGAWYRGLVAEVDLDDSQPYRVAIRNRDTEWVSPEDIRTPECRFAPGSQVFVGALRFSGEQDTQDTPDTEALKTVGLEGVVLGFDPVNDRYAVQMGPCAVYQIVAASALFSSVQEARKAAERYKDGSALYDIVSENREAYAGHSSRALRWFSTQLETLALERASEEDDDEDGYEE